MNIDIKRTNTAQKKVDIINAYTPRKNVNINVGPIVKETITKFAKEHHLRPVQARVVNHLKTRGGQINYKYNRNGHREEIKTKIRDSPTARAISQLHAPTIGNVQQIKVSTGEN